MSTDVTVRVRAGDAFTQARRRVLFRKILSVFTGSPPAGLLSFDEVRHKLKIHGQHYAGLQTIPLEAIAGSVGRYQEFNRAFLPTQDFVRERWTRVYAVAHSPAGFPPIDVYQIGDVYFVRDGHNRVSVLKELGATTIEATVTELETPIPLSAGVADEELDLKGEYAAFLEQTGLGSLRPGQSIEFTLPGQYLKLLEHIAVHRYYLGLAAEREIPYPEAVGRWYDEVYAPAVQAIREEGVLDEFPGRTEADLYLWTLEHRYYLQEQDGQEVPVEQAAVEFSREFSKGAGKKQLEADVKKAKDSAKKKGRSAATVAVFGSGSAPADHPVLAEAERLGRLLAEAGFTLVNGGYGGTMEAASRGARQAGGQVLGVTMDLFTPRLKPNPWLTKEERVKDFFPRLKELTAAGAFVVLRGGVGTLTELSLAWSLLQTGQISPRPLILVGESWRHLLEAFRAETFVSENDLALVTLVDDVDQALAVLKGALAPTP